MRHLIETSDLSTDEIERILHKATQFLPMLDSTTLDSSKRPAQSLAHTNIITIFFENSTRTLSSFECAVKNLGGSITRLDVSRSSTSKGETISDTAANLNAMSPHAIIIRHQSSGAPVHLTKSVSCPIINGGDGAHAHPTQALLDLLTLRQCLGQNLAGKRIGIIGDIKTSRVANSNIELLSRYGAELVLIAPPHFLPPHSKLAYTHDITEVIDSLHAIISLRTQTERHSKQNYGSLRDYANQFCLTKQLIGDRDIVIMHPGPVHHNIDIEDELLKDSRCKVLQQVRNGVAVRMAVLEFFILETKA
ncbi:aspartate carbamoyltransferase catalytic subunit [Helicobacter canis]|uniref:Aspartate carbamoyltransferase n=2 Tax=Helicobacter canis TaxID=29419 RepID=V8CEY2_9HELI|nr:aspartate carbamoyltransferase catalytic subunit [Helicobacter canis]ETD25924.1 aspartate carbamoyltransferase [Helicobacter canis NCTC 12740]KAA8707366.1 aspartate carbamoyltransferase catalytic subunit [Helicobacter canis]